MPRPDFSNYLGHFSSGRSPLGSQNVDNPGNQFMALSAMDRIVSMLQMRCIVASDMPWTGRRAVCFTECPWSSLLDHASRYSPYALGFAKPRVFAAGGGPVYYVRADHWEKQTWHDHLKTFVTPFWPAYRAPTLRGNEYLGGKTVDFSHEREWRIPHNFTFEYDQVEFVIVNTYEDMAQFPRELKDAVGRDRFLIMDVYRNVERLWPVHHI